MSNFAFLQAEWPMLFDAATKAEAAAHTDPRASCFYARRSLEIAVQWLYRYDASFRLPYQDNLAALIHAPSFQKNLGTALFTKARLIKDLGNQAVHSQRKITATDSLTTTRELFHICFWIARTYSRAGQPAADLDFNAELLPKTSPIPKQTIEQLQRLEAELQARDEKLSELLKDKDALTEELKRLREELEAAKRANATHPDTHDYSEAATRKAYIDVLLKEAGWELEPSKNFEVEVTGMPNEEKIGYVDYVLWGDDGKPLALIEAKRTTRDARVGRQQAKLYADCLEEMYGQRPIIFYSNGYQHWIWDDTLYAPRAVQGFYKKPELELLIQRRTTRKKLADAVINPEIVERYYQTRAVRRVGAAFEQDNQRRALLVMATGAGKTRTVIALVDVLMRCNWVKRVLFLADRKALVKQAVNAFKKHLPNSAPVNLLEDKDAEGRVFVSTYPTMMGLIDETSGNERRFGVGHFDLVIIDEAHRSVYQKYGAIFDYFDSLLIGLTATPKDEIDRNTYNLFQLETGVPTDAYDLENAVADGHLVPSKAISVPLKFQRDGIKYDDLSEEEKEEWDVTEWNDDGTVPDQVAPTALNKWLFNADTVDKVLEVLMTRGHKVAGGDRLGKTIIFAANQPHADFIAERFEKNYHHYKGSFARVITHDVTYAQSLIDDFSDKEKSPHIAISVDMLDTGIDVPEVVNLVFFKTVHSRTKFWQMVGRGTRLCKDLYGPGENKEDFFIFDFCQNLEFFSQNPNISEGSSSESLSTRLFKSRIELISELDKVAFTAGGVVEPSVDYADNLTPQQVRVDTALLLQGMVATMNLENFVVRPQRQHVEKFAKSETWLNLGLEAQDELRNHVASLPTELPDEDEEAKRFDMLVLRAQLAILQANKSFSNLRERIQELANRLSEETAIPAVKAQMVLIERVLSDEWWQDVTVPMLELVRRRLRGLIKLIPKGERKIIYTNFQDEVGALMEVDLPQVTGGLDMARFIEKARQFLRAHESHLSLRRLRTNQPLTETDLKELERMLVDAGGSDSLIDKLKKQNHGLGLFIRSLVGLDREAAVLALSEFTSGTTLTSDQIEFVDLII